MWKPRVIRTISASNSSIFSYVIRPGASSGRQAKLDIVWCGYEEWFQSSLFTSRAHLTMIIQYSLSRSHSIWEHYLREYVLIGAVSFYLYRMAFNISCFSNSSVKFFFVITNAIYSDTDIRENWKKYCRKSLHCITIRNLNLALLIASFPYIHIPSPWDAARFT